MQAYLTKDPGRGSLCTLAKRKKSFGGVQIAGVYRLQGDTA
jgi:hypothetical protein